MEIFFRALFILVLCSQAFADHPTVCPLGYDQIDRICFKLLMTPLNFWEANTACDVVDGKLVEIATPEDQTRVTKYLNAHVKPDTKLNKLWMGATNLQGKWMYLSSSNQHVLDTWSSWGLGYPMKDEDNNCAALSQGSTWKWENSPCSYHQGALCYVKLRDDGSSAVIG